MEKICGDIDKAIKEIEKRMIALEGELAKLDPEVKEYQKLKDEIEKELDKLKN